MNCPRKKSEPLNTQKFDINTTEGARQYLISEGIDPDEIVSEGMYFINNLKAYLKWKKELIEITARETGTPENQIKINDKEARDWFESGIPAYYCFRENFNI